MISHHLNLPSALQKISPVGFDHVNLYIKRDDLINPFISGNKWRKLQKTITNFDFTTYNSVITFGGAFSNHLVATAVACSLYKIKCSAFVRTEAIDPQNPTLNLCIKYGMKLIPLPRSVYSQHSHENFISNIHKDYHRALIIPEGGFHPDAMEGLEDMIREIKTKIHEPDLYLVSLGTGCTASGIIDKLGNAKLWISPAIKQFDEKAMMRAHSKLSNADYPSRQVHILYHDDDKAYAKKDLGLFLEIQEFLLETGILLDPIYTGKAWRTLKSKIVEIEEGSNIVWIHTGGAQAWHGYFYRYPTLKEQVPHIYKVVSTAV